MNWDCTFLEGSILPIVARTKAVIYLWSDGDVVDRLPSGELVTFVSLVDNYLLIVSKSSTRWLLKDSNFLYYFELIS